MDIKKLAALCEAASPGPWTVEVDSDSTLVSSAHWDIAFSVSNPDAEFIAAAREAIPALLARVKELEMALPGLDPVLGGVS